MDFSGVKRNAALLTVVIVVVAISAGFYLLGNQKVVRDLGNAELVQERYEGTKITKISYEKDGKKFEGVFPQRMEESLQWINSSTPEGAKITSWWDYGHAIRGYTGRDVFAYSPSRKALEEITESSDWSEKEGELISAEKMEALADVFVSPVNRSAEIMREYNSSYLLIHWSDVRKYISIAKVEGDYSSTSRIQVFRSGRSKRNALIFNSRGNTLRVKASKQGISSAQIDGTEIRHACTESGIRKISDGRIAGCVMVKSRRKSYYIPQSSMNSALVRLYLMDGANQEVFKKEYDGKWSEIWRIENRNP